jgi:hypothetical protein
MSQDKKIIAISGWKRSGKDTAANFLIKNMDFKRVGFADPLKEMVAQEYNIPIHYCYEDNFKEKPLLQYPVDPQDDFTMTISKLLKDEFKSIDGLSYQQLGEKDMGLVLTETMYWTPRALCILKGSINRAVTSDYWVKQAVKLANEELNDSFNKGVVISDLRYRSEVEQLRDSFGDKLVTVRISRFDSVDTTDPSERDLDDYKFDYTIQNKGTIENLQDAITGVVYDANGRKS